MALWIPCGRRAILVSRSQKPGGGLVASFPTHQWDSKAEASERLVSQEGATRLQIFCRIPVTALKEETSPESFRNL